MPNCKAMSDYTVPPSQRPRCPGAVCLRVDKKGSTGIGNEELKSIKCSSSSFLIPLIHNVKSPLCTNYLARSFLRTAHCKFCTHRRRTYLRKQFPLYSRTQIECYHLQTGQRITGPGYWDGAVVHRLLCCCFLFC